LYVGGSSSSSSSSSSPGGNSSRVAIHTPATATTIMITTPIPIPSLATPLSEIIQPPNFVFFSAFKDCGWGTLKKLINQYD
jgi:hypothetical protein